MFGKDIADKMITKKGRKNYNHNQENGWNFFKGNALTLGGEGMKGFYDQMLPSFVNKYAKKWGTKVEDISLPGLQNEDGWHSIDVTPEMKESVLEDQVMFSKSRNMESGLSALRKIANGEEEVDNAMIRNDLEQYGGTTGITFVFGKPGDPKKEFKGGYGISHIATKHGVSDLFNVIRVVAEAPISRYVEGNKTVVIGDGEYEAVLALTQNGNKKTWLLSGWEIKEKAGDNSEVSTQSISTQTNPTFSREDLGAAVSSISKDINYSEDSNKSDKITSEQYKAEDESIDAVKDVSFSKIQDPELIKKLDSEAFFINARNNSLEKEMGKVNFEGYNPTRNSSGTVRFRKPLGRYL